MSIIVAGRSPRLAVPFSGDRELLRGAIRAAAPTDEPGNLRDSLLFALSLRDPNRGDQVILVTDGAGDLPGSVDLAVPWLRILRVGSSRPNVGITAMQLRRTLRGEEEYEFFLTVNNWSSRPVTVPLSVSADRSAERKPIVAERVSLAPGEERSLSLPWKGPTEGHVVASIATGDDFPDDFPIDDAAYAVFAPAHAVRVLLVGPGNPFLEKGLSALPNVTVRKADQLGEAPSDVVVFDGTEVPQLEKGNYILFASVPPNLPLRITGSLSVPPVTSWARNHPLLDSVSLQGLAIEQAYHLEPGAGFSPLALSNGSPLMLAWDHAGLKVIVVAFDARRTDFPLRAGFPVFLANALSWFFPSWLSVQAEQVQAGRPKVLSAGSGKLVVERPDGTRVTIGSSEQSVQFDDTAEVGFYRVESGGSLSEFAVNLLSPEESNLSPRLAVVGQGEGGTAVEPQGIGGESGAPLWGALCLLAAVFMLAEWLSWLRSPDMRGTRR
jgi:hypothetical protein